MKHFANKLSSKSPTHSSPGGSFSDSSDLFKVQKTVRHGLPYDPATLAYDPIQKIIAVGSAAGDIRIFGRPGAETYMCQEERRPIKQLFFSVNEGALLSITADDCLHLWNLRQRTPKVVQSLLFKRESVCVCKLPIFSKWIYVGTEKGNIYVVNLESLELSGYQVMWNQTIPKSQVAHPGPVTVIEEHPVDPSKLLLGYENGRLVVWDLKAKEVVKSYSTDRPLSCAFWMSDVKQFITGHIEGSLAVWNHNTSAGEGAPTKLFKPHEFHEASPTAQPCGLVRKVAWLSTRSDPYLIFSGGVPGPCSSHHITVFHGRRREVFKLERPVVDFIVVCASPYARDIQEPSAVIVLVSDNILSIDLTSPEFTLHPTPYGVTMGAAPVTYLGLFENCSTSLMNDLRMRQDTSPMNNWPIDGGDWGRAVESSSDLSITGHSNGSLQFWDVSGVTMQHLCTLQTGRFFEGPLTVPDSEESLVGVTHISLCVQGRVMVVALSSAQLLIFNWGNAEISGVLCTVQVLLAQPEFTTYDFDSMEEESTSPTDSPKTPGLVNTPDSISEEQKKASHLLSKFGIEVPSTPTSEDTKAGPMLAVTSKEIRQHASFQAILAVQCTSSGLESPGQISCVDLSTAWGLVAFGNTLGVVIVDYVQRSVLWSYSNLELVGLCSPNVKTPLSSKNSNSKSKKLKIVKLGSFNSSADEEGARNRKSVQRGKMLSIIRRDKMGSGETTPTNLNCHKKAKKQGSGGSVDSPNSPSSVTSESDLLAHESGFLENFLVQRLCFIESYTDKDISGNLTAPRRNPILWMGSYNGVLLSQTINIPPGDHRRKIPCQVGMGGSPVLLKSPIIGISALDNEGTPVSAPAQSWGDKKRRGKNRKGKAEGEGESELQSNDYLVLAAEKSILVLKLPSQNSYARQKVFDNTYYLKSQVLWVEGWGACIVCLSIMGSLSFYSLPQLKPLLNVSWFDAKDSRSLRTFTATSQGHCFHLCSPSELQGLSLLNQNHLLLPESLAMLFAVREAPEPPRPPLLALLLRSHLLDRGELFGPGSGPVSPGLAEKLVRRYDLNLSRVKEALVEREEKLNEIGQKAEQLSLEAESFASASHLLHLKAKEQNKWF